MTKSTIDPSAANAGNKGNYASVNRLNMYYEVHGSGRPLVLLHGGISNIETDFGLLLPGLVKSRQVIAIEQRAHGRTADIDRPLSVEQMAEDTAALLRQIGVENADFSATAWDQLLPCRSPSSARSSCASSYWLRPATAKMASIPGFSTGSTR